MTTENTTTSTTATATAATPAATPTSSGTFDRAIFIEAARLLLKTFDPGDSGDAGALSIPGSVVSSDDRRAYALLSAQMYANAGLPTPAAAWRIRHAAEAGVITTASKWRYVAKTIGGDAVVKAETETRALIRQLADRRVQEALVTATQDCARQQRRVADLLERIFGAARSAPEAAQAAEAAFKAAPSAQAAAQAA